MKSVGYYMFYCCLILWSLGWLRLNKKKSQPRYFVHKNLLGIRQLVVCHWAEWKRAIHPEVCGVAFCTVSFASLMGGQWTTARVGFIWLFRPFLFFAFLCLWGETSDEMKHAGGAVVLSGSKCTTSIGCRLLFDMVSHFSAFSFISIS